MELGFTLLDVENLLVQMDVAAAAPPKSDAGAASSTLEPGSPLAAPHGDVPNLSAGATDCRYVRVLHDLCVHGEAWKLGGSPHWRVLSDARVKRVLGPFAPGGETLGKLKPRVFRYKGQPGHEAPFAGIIAQELPEELAPHCRFRTPLKQLRAGHGAAATLRHATAPSRPSPEAGAAVPSVPAAPTSPVSSSPPEAHLAAVPLPWVRDLSGTDRARVAGWMSVQVEGDADGTRPAGVQTDTMQDEADGDEAAGAVDREADDDWLYLVDTTALQFVLLNTAAALQREMSDQQAQIDALRSDIGM